MEDTSAIVLVFDGLSPGFLGPYGNTWNPTPTFNQLAAESLLIEHALADDPRSAAHSRLHSLAGLWDGRHALCPPPSVPGRLLRQCAEQGICAALVCDDAQVAQFSADVGFARVRALPEQPATAPAEDESATRFGQLIGAAVDELAELPPRHLLWVQASTLLHAWDAPRQLCAELLDAADPQPPDEIAAPQMVCDASIDPDLAWGLAVRYAAEVRAIDACLAVLLAAVRSAAMCPATLLALTATHGYPLGEHRFVGATASGTLHSELVQVPFLLRYPDGQRAMQRDQRLCQSPTVYTTLAEWLGMELAEPGWGAHGLTGAPPLRAVSRLGDRLALRTPAWYALVQGDIQQGELQLYVKPDDRWDFNDVSQLCAEEAQLARHELAAFMGAAESEQLDCLPALPRVLAQTLR